MNRTYGLNTMTESHKANIESNIVSIILAGAFSGSVMAPWIASRIGHRPTLMCAAVIVIIGISLQAAASGIIAALYVGRFVAGIAIGMSSTINPLYVSENAPRAIRGLLTGMYQFNIVTGLCVSSKVKDQAEPG